MKDTVMNEMVERVTGIIRNGQGRLIEEVARDVIAAIREPTDEMINAAPSLDAPGCCFSVVEVWQAMIDEIVDKIQ